jgi:ferrochelatase
LEEGMNARIGVLLVNLGTPERLDLRSVARYLAEFLDDPRVIDLPTFPRRLLLYGLILPFRSRRSLHAYRAIWTEDGSPLRLHTEKLAMAVQGELGSGFVVMPAMRYGKPSLTEALDHLAELGCERLVLAPLYPQYASSSTGTVLQAALSHLAPRWNLPSLGVVPPFYAAPEFLDLWAAHLLEQVGSLDEQDFVLFSFHGLPERHLRRGDPSGHCLSFPDCCATPGKVPFCYRAQCFSTARALAQRLNLSADRSCVSFQSRLGRQPWLEPATSEVLVELAARGVQRLVVTAPSFVADCLETLEELGISGRRAFLDAGGSSFQLVPCLNHDSRWAAVLASLVRRAVPGGSLD